MTTLGINTISDLRLGSSQVQAAYLGDQLVWSHESPQPSYWGLCFTAEEPGAIVSMTKTGTPPSVNLLYSTDASTWSTFTPGTTTVTLADVGDKVWLKAGSGGNTAFATNTSNYMKFATSKANASGNIMSLLDGEQQQTSLSAAYCFLSLFAGSSTKTAPALPATLLAGSCYRNMFQGCTSLTSAPELPATTLAEGCYSVMFSGCISLTSAPALPATTLFAFCYRNMFQGCTSLSAAPALPATTLAERCYNSMFSGCTSLSTAPALPATLLATLCYKNMFQGCTSLTSAPELPATTLAEKCYSYMFQNCRSLSTSPSLSATTLAGFCCENMFLYCTSLSAAPALPATTLANNCYSYMFQGCTSLTSISAAFTEWNPSNATINWVSDVSSSGTFYCPASLGTNDTIQRGVDYCPTNWNVVNKTYFRYSDGTSYMHDINGTLTRQAVLDTIAQDNKVSSALRYVYMGSDITAVGPSAFSDWSYLRGIVIGENVEIVDDNAFRRDASISSITFAGTSLTAIGPYGFAGVQNTGRYDLPEGLQTIGNNAFVYGGSAPNGLSVVSIPSTVTSIGGSAFSNSNALLSVIFNGKTMNEVTAMTYYPWGASGKIYALPPASV